MKKIFLIFILVLISVSIILFASFIFATKSATIKSANLNKQATENYKIDSSKLLIYEVNPKQTKLDFYWKDETGKNYENFAFPKLFAHRRNFWCNYSRN